ncbi:MAG TPA: PAS domain S-box protein [Pyrinomonadaceae bacterium]|nr:PAS domain S-box protein [Pyrinomonadaceae bacterium]
MKPGKDRRARDVLDASVEELQPTRQQAQSEANRKRVENELRERAAELSEAQRLAKVGNWSLDLRTDELTWSEQLYRIFEIEEREFDRRYELFLSRVHPEDQPRVLETNSRTRIEGCPFDLEYRIVIPNDEVRFIRELGYAEKDEAGKVIRLFGTAQDITDRKLIETALDERLRFETLLTELSAAFAKLTTNEVDHEIDRWMQRLVKFLGVDRASFLQFGSGGTLYRSHSYTVPGIEALPPPPFEFKDQFPWITDQLRRGVTVKWSRIPEDIPAEAANERKYAARLGVKSGLTIPVIMGGSVICAISFTSIVSYRDWPDAMVARLRLVGEIFAGVIERKRVHAALRHSEEQFRQMAENIREVFWLATADLSNMLYISPAYETVWGRSCESLYQEPRSFFSAIHPEDRDGMVAIMERDREQGFEVEYRVVRPDGTVRCIWNRGFPIKDDSGCFYRVAGIAEDITERKHAEALLHAREQEFRAIVENAPDHIARYDRELRRTYANPALARSFGLPAEDLIGRQIFSVHREGGLDFQEEVVKPIRQRFAEVFDTGESYELEVTLPMPRGLTDYSFRLFPELDVDGSVINVLTIARDITASKRAEEELKKEKEILETIFDNIPVLIGFIGDDGAVTMVNPEWERIMGWTLEELHDQNVDIMVEAFPDPESRREFMDLVAASTGEWVDLRIKVRSGRVIDAACAFVKLSDRTKLGFAQDITERKQAEEQLKATSEQLRALTARLQSAREEEGIRIAREIHDELGAALTSLRWDLETANKSISEGANEPQVGELHQKMRTMIRLTETTIDRVRRIASELRPVALDDVGLIAAIKWQARQFQARTGINVNYENILTNANLSREQSTAAFHIFQETLTNIVRHARATAVSIEMTDEDGEFVLTISDDGRGITDEEKLGKHTLGLLGMRERAHIAGAKIEVTRVEKKGTVVKVRIPRFD